MGKKQITSNELSVRQENQEIPLGYPISNLSDDEVPLERFPGGVIITNEAGRVISFNQPALDILGQIPNGVGPDEWSQRFGLYLQDGTRPNLDKEFPLQLALRGETVEGKEMYCLQGGAGEKKWFSISGKPLRSSTGKITGAILLLNDITPYKQTEISYQNKFKKLEAASRLQTKIAEIGNDPLKILDLVADFAIKNIGDGCIAALLNLPADKLRVVAFHHVNHSARELLSGSIMQQEFGLETAIAGVIQSGEPLLVPEVKQERLSKVTSPTFKKYVEDFGLQSLLVVPIKGHNRTLGTLSLIRDRGGIPYSKEDQQFMSDLALRTGMAIDNNYLVNLLRAEISGRRTAEKALEFSEARFQSIFTSTALGMKLLDEEGKILETNPAFQQMLGYSEDELRGHPLSSFWHPADVKYLFQVLEQLNTNKVKSLRLVHRLIDKDRSTRWANVTFTGIKKDERDVSLSFIVAITEDITEHKRAEAEISRMKSRLQSHVELERLRLAQELHDGPLQDLYSAIYKIEAWGKEEMPDHVDQVNDLKKDLLSIVQGLRSTAKDLRPPALAEFGLEKAIRSHAEEFQESHPSINIHLDLAHDGKILPEDIRLILFRIYQHSITNILRHAEACDIKVTFSFDSEEARLEIQDNGSGFEVPTNWMDLVRQGHYGLAGAVERVSLLDGSFTVESQQDQGTTVKVEIPIVNSTDSNGNTKSEG